MAVFPTARRALSRPRYFSWLFTAVVLAVAITVPAFALPYSTPHAFAEAPDSVNDRPAPKATYFARIASLIHDVQAKVESPAGENLAEVSSAVAEGPASGTVESPGSGAPATQTEAAVPQPVSPVGAGGLDPIARWATHGIIIETEGQHLDEFSLANVDAALSAIPAHVLDDLGNAALGPLRILVNADGRVLSGDRPYGGPANFFSTNEGRNELVLYPQQSVFTIVHELGHAYNLRRIDAGRYAMVLLDPEMRSFLNATNWSIRSNPQEIQGAIDHMHVAYAYGGDFHWPRLSHDDPLEDFANSFASFFLEPQALQEASPERYAWMLATFGQ